MLSKWNFYDYWKNVKSLSSRCVFCFQKSLHFWIMANKPFIGQGCWSKEVVLLRKNAQMCSWEETFPTGFAPYTQRDLDNLVGRKARNQSRGASWKSHNFTFCSERQEKLKKNISFSNGKWKNWPLKSEIWRSFLNN